METSKKQITITVDLTDTDLQAFVARCYEAGAAPSDVLGGFINDLVDGAYTRGSDERELAVRYLERCAYAYSGALSFAHYLLAEWGMEDVEVAIDDIETAEGELSYYAEHPDDPDRDAVDWQAELTQAKEVIAERYAAYTEYAHKMISSPESLEEGIEGVKRYLHMLAELSDSVEVVLE